MNRRQELRHAVDQSVRVKLLADPSAVITGHIVDVSDNGMQLCLSDPIPNRSTVEVECEDFILRGTVVYSRLQRVPQGPDYTVGMQIEHACWEPIDPFQRKTTTVAVWSN
jgi:hypothetical protein